MRNAEIELPPNHPIVDFVTSRFKARELPPSEAYSPVRRSERGAMRNAEIELPPKPPA